MQRAAACRTARHLGVILMLILPAIRPALARDDPRGGCGSHPPVQPIDLSAAFSGGDPRVRHAWGQANVENRPHGIRVAYPQGSIDPGNDTAPRGGAGLMLHQGPGAHRGCLSYKVRFADGFQFARGGKLPGLFGGEAPRGCTPEELSHGFSARLMWREGGKGELYLYAPGRSTRCGDSIGRGAWVFTPGTWTSIEEEVVMNTPGVADGAVRVWIDGQLAIEQEQVALRESAEIKVDGLLFSTFFGGHDKSWASPVLQYAEFTDFTLTLEGSGR